MVSSLNSSLAANLIGSIVLVLVLDGLIFGLGWDLRSAVPTDMPGWFVASVWIMLFALMGLARWHLATIDDRSKSRGVVIVTALIVLCAAYPFYALLTGSRIAGLAGNIITIVVAAAAMYGIWPLSRKAAILVFPVVPWVTFASWTIVQSQSWL